MDSTLLESEPGLPADARPTGVDAMQSRIAELEAAKAAAERELRHVGLRAAALRAENDFLREQVANARWWRELARIQVRRIRPFAKRFPGRMKGMTVGALRRAKGLARRVAKKALGRV